MRPTLDINLLRTFHAIAVWGNFVRRRPLFIAAQPR